MNCFRITTFDGVHQGQISVSNYDSRIRQIQTSVQEFQLYNNSNEVLLLLFFNESEGNVETRAQGGVVHDNQHRHFVSVRLVGTIQNQNFGILAKNLLDVLVDEEQFSDSFGSLLQKHLREPIRSV